MQLQTTKSYGPIAIGSTDDLAVGKAVGEEIANAEQV